VEEIGAASPRLETIIMGPVNVSASMGMPSLSGSPQIPDYPGDYFHYAFVKILMAERANGLQVIDGPYVKVRDTQGFRDYATRAQTLGFDRKWSLHPDQVGICNEVYSPTQEQFDKAWNVLESYRQATEGDRKGAVKFGDEMIDEASRKVAITLVAKGERAGMRPSSSRAPQREGRPRPAGRRLAPIPAEVAPGRRRCRSQEPEQPVEHRLLLHGTEHG
jgi:citrate lyase subunit beta / citryl-CoA lyase